MWTPLQLREEAAREDEDADGDQDESEDEEALVDGIGAAASATASSGPDYIVLRNDDDDGVHEATAVTTGEFDQLEDSSTRPRSTLEGEVSTDSTVSTEDSSDDDSDSEELRAERVPEGVRARADGRRIIASHRRRTKPAYTDEDIRARVKSQMRSKQKNKAKMHSRQQVKAKRHREMVKSAAAWA